MSDRARAALVQRREGRDDVPTEAQRAPGPDWLEGEADWRTQSDEEQYRRRMPLPRPPGWVEYNPPRISQDLRDLVEAGLRPPPTGKGRCSGCRAEVSPVVDWEGEGMSVGHVPRQVAKWMCVHEPDCPVDARLEAEGLVATQERAEAEYARRASRART